MTAVELPNSHAVQGFRRVRDDQRSLINLVGKPDQRLIQHTDSGIEAGRVDLDAADRILQLADRVNELRLRLQQRRRDDAQRSDRADTLTQHNPANPEVKTRRGGSSAAGDPLSTERNTVSTQNNTYEAGLVAAMHALDALADTYAAEAKAHNMENVGDDYDPDVDTRLTHRYVGVVDAFGLIAGMLSDYRKASA